LDGTPTRSCDENGDFGVHSAGNRAPGSGQPAHCRADSWRGRRPHPPAGRRPVARQPGDEVVTGGAITDFVWLLDHLLGSAGASRPDASIADVVREGGAVVVVQAADDEEAARVQAFLLQSGASKQAFIPREGDLD
jgi:hypothetical protein